MIPPHPPQSAMAELEPKLDSDAVNALIQGAFPLASREGMPRVTAVAPGRVRIMMPYREGLLRPGA